MVLTASVPGHCLSFTFDTVCRLTSLLLMDSVLNKYGRGQSIWVDHFLIITSARGTMYDGFSGHFCDLLISFFLFLCCCCCCFFRFVVALFDLVYTWRMVTANRIWKSFLTCE